MNNYKTINDQQLSNIVGGNRVGNAIIQGISGAATGVRICKGFGPWGMAACGVVGGGIGAYFGYHS